MNIYDELITILQDGKELGFTYDEIDDIIKALERAKKVEEELEEYKISDKSKEESSIEYYNLYKETKRKLKKVEELLEFYKQLGGIEQDIEYLCGLRDCMIEHSLEKPMGHIYIGIKEYKEKRDGLNYQIKKLEEELK